MRISVRDVAGLLGGELTGDAALELTDAQSIEYAGPEEITFADGEQNLRKLADCRAGAAIIRKGAVLPDGSRPSAIIFVDEPQLAFLKVLQHCRPARPRPDEGISKAAAIAPGVQIGENTNIRAGVHIAADVVIGQGCDIHSGVVIGPGCRIGDQTTLYPNVVLYHDVTIGHRVAIHAGAVIGADGFGYRVADGRREKIPHFGKVRIEDDVEIGACTTVDRAMIGETVIGEGSKLDNLVMIAHNCKLGKHNALVAQVGLAGSVTTGDYVVCAGHVGVADHVHLGEGCVIGSKSGVPKDIPAGETWIGTPAQPAAEAMKVLMAQKKLPAMRKTLRGLESQLAELRTRIDSLSVPTDEPTGVEPCSAA